MERKSRMFSKHQENQLKDIQLPKSYTVRFALNLGSTKYRASEFILKVFLLRKQGIQMALCTKEETYTWGQQWKAGSTC